MRFQLNTSQRIVCWFTAAIIAAIQAYDFLENGIDSIRWIVSLTVIFILVIFALNKNSEGSTISTAAPSTTDSSLYLQSTTSIPQHDQLVPLLVKSINKLTSEIREELKKINPKLVATHPAINSFVGPTNRSTMISYCMVCIAFNSEPRFTSHSRQLHEARDLVVGEMIRTEAVRLSAELDFDDRKIMVSKGGLTSEQKTARNDVKEMNAGLVAMLRTQLNSDLQELETAGSIVIANLKQDSPDALNPLYLALRRFMVGDISISNDQFANEYGALIHSWIVKAREILLRG